MGLLVKAGSSRTGLFLYYLITLPGSKPFNDAASHLCLGFLNKWPPLSVGVPSDAQLLMVKPGINFSMKP